MSLMRFSNIWEIFTKHNLTQTGSFIAHIGQARPNFVRSFGCIQELGLVLRGGGREGRSLDRR